LLFRRVELRVNTDIDIIIPMIAIVTSNSISVKPQSLDVFLRLEHPFN